MCCGSKKSSIKQHEEKSCGCHGHGYANALFWSNKKKIEVLEQHREQLQEQMDEIDELIKELKK